MKIFLALRAVVFAVLFLNFCAKADDSAHIVCSARDLGQTVIAKRLFTLTPVAPLARTISTNLFSKEPKSLSTSVDGVCTFSNVIWGYYRLDLAPNNSWNLLLGTNQSGLVSASVLITNSAATPPDPATNYYTMAQTDVLLTGIELGSGFQHGNQNLTNLSINNAGNLTNLTAGNLTGTIPTNTFPAVIPSITVNGELTVSELTATNLVVDNIYGSASGLTNFNLSFATNYFATNFIPIPGQMRFCISNNAIWLVTEGLTNLLKADER